jgi:hypothetical protein
MKNNTGSVIHKEAQRINFIFNKNGQSSTIELAVFIVCLIWALIAMQGYITRGIQGGLRESADSIGPQYDPTKTLVDYNTTSTSDLTTQVIVDVDRVNNEVNSTTVVTTNLDEQSRSGVETVGAF